VTEPEPAAPALREPWRISGGPLALWRQRSLLWGLIRGNRYGRHQGTVLGSAWDFIDPVVQFTVYFVVIGVLLGLSRSVENFPLYIFSGLITVQVFNTGLSQATTVFTRGRVLVRRVPIPLAMLTASRVGTALISTWPALLILLLASVGFGIVSGYDPDPIYIPIAIGGVILLVLFTFGLGLVFGVANVFIRDTRHVVGVITTLSRWAVPVIYPWTLVPEKFGEGIVTTLYLANPVTIAVFGVREVFWHPTTDTGLPPIPLQSVVVGIALTLALLVLGFVLAHRYHDRIVQRLRWTT
jgi:ABC-2 type transport system permease protein